MYILMYIYIFIYIYKKRGIERQRRKTEKGDREIERGKSKRERGVKAKREWGGRERTQEDVTALLWLQELWNIHV